MGSRQITWGRLCVSGSQKTLDASQAIYAMRHHAHKDRTRVKGTNYSAKKTKERMDAVMAQRELNSINNDDLMPSLIA